MAIISGLSLAAVLGYLAAGAGAVSAGGLAGTLLDKIIKEAEKQKWLNKTEVDEIEDRAAHWLEPNNENSWLKPNNENSWLTKPRTDSSFNESTTGGETPPTNEEDKKTPIGPGVTGELSGSEESGDAIKDGTDENTGTTTVTPMDWIAKIEEWRDNDRAREDQIRAETQAREDSAWQRGIEDLRKSGANINLMAAQPAASGGGITSATGVNTSVLTNSMNNEIKEMLQVLEQNFKGDENDKDRFMQSFSHLMSLASLIIALTGRK